MAMDLLGHAKPNRPTDGPSQLRRRSEGCLRCHSAVATWLRFLYSSIEDGHQLLAHRGPMGEADGAYWLLALRRVWKRLGSDGLHPTRPQICRSDDRDSSDADYSAQCVF